MKQARDTPYVADLLRPCNISIVDHYSVKGGLKDIDCIFQSAEYWCPNVTPWSWSMSGNNAVIYFV